MNRFDIISEKQFDLDITKNESVQASVGYNDIIVPRRATKYSAGYDFFAPFDIVLEPGQSIKIPTGIRMMLDTDKFLAIVPRSGLGFKYRVQLDNTIGIIDADYYGSSNEGHIWVKITNDTHDDKIVKILKGEAFAQGIILPYYRVDEDNVESTRDGGFGSTTGKNN